VSQLNDRKGSLRNAKAKGYRELQQKRDHERLLFNARIARYRRRDRAGLKVTEIVADPVEVRDLCDDAGIDCPGIDALTRSKAMSVFFEYWRKGWITIVPSK
jgi:hypothetical protein